jgi:hypothetical protein
MLAGDSPQQIIDWLVANDANNNPNNRQYGIASFVNGAPQTAGYTGSGTLNYKNHITGPNYSIQGNILSGQAILDSMESRFLNEPGDLACKLMAALQGAKVPGADTRCANNGEGTSSLFAFLKVAQAQDEYGSPSLLLGVKTPGGAGIEPIDSLQSLFDGQHSCSQSVGIVESKAELSVYPNPTRGILHIHRSDADNSVYNYLLRDAFGRRAAEGRIESAKHTLDLSALQKGFYVLELSSGAERFTVFRLILID